MARHLQGIKAVFRINNIFGKAEVLRRFRPGGVARA
jgi:hypothetical protein